LTNQGLHVAKVALAHILRLPAALVQVKAPPDIGGSFGWKSAIYREPFAVAFAATKLKRSVVWVQDRREALTAGSHERDQIVDIEGAFDSDGRLRGFRARIIGDVGCAKIDQYYYLIPLLSALSQHPYALDAFAVTADAVVTNKAPQVVNRTAGRMPMTFALERLMDLAARELQIDRVELRRRNLINAARPGVTGNRDCLDSDIEGVFETLLNAMNYPTLQEEIAAERETGRYLGLGVSACFDDASPFSSPMSYVVYHQPTYATARVKVEVDGEVVVFAGDSPQGQNRETTVAMVVGDQLGVDADTVRVKFGDTSLSPFNNHGSHTETAAHIAAKRLREKMLRIGAHLLALDGPDACELRAGHVVNRQDPSGRVSLAALAHVAYLNPGALPSGLEPLLEATVVHEVGTDTAASSAHGCLVEVFPETGEFTIEGWWYAGDAGRVINPTLYEGAIQGSFATGLSNTSYEHYVYDRDGQFLTGTLTDYLMPGPLEVPRVRVAHHGVPATNSILGHKKMVTEGVPNGVPAALVAAIEHALRPLVLNITTVPITPSRIWEAITAAEACA
jgi:carbon-monoxide dehydrogenase large subunit